MREIVDRLGVRVVAAQPLQRALRDNSRHCSNAWSSFVPFSYHCNPSRVVTDFLMESSHEIDLCELP